MRIVGMKVDILLEENEQLLKLEPNYPGNFNSYHTVRVDDNPWTIPPLPRPTKIKAVILLLEEQYPQ